MSAPYEIHGIDGSTYIATVIDRNFDTRELAVHIPKLMPQIPTSKYTEKTPAIKNQMIINANILDDSITKRSSMWVKALDKNEPLPVEGSKVMIFFLEEDPENGFWEPFNVMNVDYEEDPDDKFEKEKIFTFTFKYDSGSTGEMVKSIDIHKGDNVQFNISGIVNGVGVYRDIDDRSIVNIDIQGG